MDRDPNIVDAGARHPCSRHRLRASAARCQPHRRRRTAAPRSSIPARHRPHPYVLDALNDARHRARAGRVPVAHARAPRSRGRRRPAHGGPAATRGRAASARCAAPRRPGQAHCGLDRGVRRRRVPRAVRRDPADSGRTRDHRQGRGAAPARPTHVRVHRYAGPCAASLLRASISTTASSSAATRSASRIASSTPRPDRSRSRRRRRCSSIPMALHASIDRLLTYRPERIALTHYGPVGDLERLAGDLHECIDEFVRIARRHAAERGSHHAHRGRHVSTSSASGSTGTVSMATTRGVTSCSTPTSISTRRDSTSGSGRCDRHADIQGFPHPPGRRQHRCALRHDRPRRPRCGRRS